MSPIIVGSIILGYFTILIIISWVTSKNSTDADFYNASRQSPWYLVAFGMIGASLSGVTFISVPGEVGNSNFYYFQVVIGYLFGYFIIAKVLLPLYYKLNLVSIYSYLQERFGFWSYKSGAFFFLISRVVGSSFRLFLVAGVLQISFFDAFDLPFWVSVMVTIVLIWLYTFKGGIKTIVWTDTLQTTFMLAAVVISILFIKTHFNWSWLELTQAIGNDPRSELFNWNWHSGTGFFKQILSGALIAIVMTGLDQDMMQKNLTCRTLKDAQKNVFWFCLVLVIANFLFLCLGLLLFQLAGDLNIVIPNRTDYLFPELAIHHFPMMGAIIFLLGITAAAYSSADSALTALTTSFCVDFLGFSPANYHEKKRLRKIVHLGFSTLLFIVILIFHAINDQSVITAVFTAAGYTYGPILGLFAFGIFTKVQVHDKWVPIICLTSPVISYMINAHSQEWFGISFGFMILAVNGLLTFVGLMMIRKNSRGSQV